MKKVACLAVLAAALPLTAWADCTPPKKPANPPSGAKATRAEMIAAKKVNDQYQADINAFLQCLKAEHQDALGKTANWTEDEKKKLVDRWQRRNDSAVDEAQEVADRFNAQLKICKARADNCTK